MPLQTRIVEPVRISRFTVNESSGKTSSPVDHLESVTNGTCANIIYQLSSLSKHAENLFGELIHESHSLVARVGALKIRSNRLSTSIRLLDIIDEEVSLINTKKVFKSTIVYDQQIFSRNSMPSSLREMYNRCDESPPLYKFNLFRNDGKDCMKFYTDINYYFNFWRSDTLKASEKILHDCEKNHCRLKSGLSESSSRCNENIINQTNNLKEPYGQLFTQHRKFITHQNNFHNDEATYQVNSIESHWSSCKSLLNIHHTVNTMIDGHTSKTLSMKNILSNNYTEPYDNNLMCGKSPLIVNNNKYNSNTKYSSNYQYAIGKTEVLNPFGKQSCGGKIRPPTPQRIDSLKRTTLSIINPTGAGCIFNFGRENLPPPPLPPIEDDIYFVKTLPPPPPPPPPHKPPISISPTFSLESIPPPPPLLPMLNELEKFVDKELNAH